MSDKEAEDLRQESCRLRRVVANLQVPPPEVFLGWDASFRNTIAEFKELKEWWDEQIQIVCDVLLATNSLDSLADRLDQKHGVQWKNKLFQPFEEALKNAWETYRCCCCCCVLGVSTLSSLPHAHTHIHT